MIFVIDGVLLKVRGRHITFGGARQFGKAGSLGLGAASPHGSHSISCFAPSCFYQNCWIWGIKAWDVFAKVFVSHSHDQAA